MDSTKFYSTDDLMNACKRPMWPPALSNFIEYSDNRYLRIANDTELRFACELVSRFHAETCNVLFPLEKSADSESAFSNVVFIDAAPGTTSPLTLESENAKHDVV
jgi:hypothetical protein